MESRYRTVPSDVGGPATELDFDKLHQELAQTRRRRVGRNFQESEDGVAALAVPLGVIDVEHAAFSIAMPHSPIWIRRWGAPREPSPANRSRIQGRHSVIAATVAPIGEMGSPLQ